MIANGQVSSYKYENYPVKYKQAKAYLYTSTYTVNPSLGLGNETWTWELTETDDVTPAPTWISFDAQPGVPPWFTVELDLSE